MPSPTQPRHLPKAAEQLNPRSGCGLVGSGRACNRAGPTASFYKLAGTTAIPLGATPPCPAAHSTKQPATPSPTARQLSPCCHTHTAPVAHPPTPATTLHLCPRRGSHTCSPSPASQACGSPLAGPTVPLPACRQPAAGHSPAAMHSPPPPAGQMPGASAVDAARQRVLPVTWGIPPHPPQANEPGTTVPAAPAAQDVLCVPAAGQHGPGGTASPAALPRAAQLATPHQPTNLQGATCNGPCLVPPPAPPGHAVRAKELKPKKCVRVRALISAATAPYTAHSSTLWRRGIFHGGQRAATC